MTPALGRRRPTGVSAGKIRLLRVQLDDELLLHRCGDLAPLRLAQHLGRERLVIGLQPRGDLAGQLGGVADDLRRRRVRLDRDDIARTHLVAGDVHAPAVDGPVSVEDELPRLAARGREAEAHEHVVQAALQQREQVLTSDARLARSLDVVAVELLLQHAVIAARLLLLAQLHAILALFHAPASVLARRVGPPLDAALVRQAALALEEQLLSLAAALLALGARVAGHRSDPPSLAGAAAVVRLRGYVLDARHFEACSLQRADRGLATGAGSLDVYLDLLETLFQALAGGRVGGHLGGEGSRLARALEAGAAGGLPRDH